MAARWDTMSVGEEVSQIAVHTCVHTVQRIRRIPQTAEQRELSRFERD